MNLLDSLVVAVKPKPPVRDGFEDDEDDDDLVRNEQKTTVVVY